MTNRTAFLAVVAALVLLGALPSALMADVEELTWTGGSFVPSANDQTVGWSFTANQAIDVSSLDWYDPTGINNIDHTVDIWTGSGTLVGTACVGLGCAGSSYSASAEYWQTPVSLSLVAGSYVIGGWVSVGDPFEQSFSTTATEPNITYGTGLYGLGGSTMFPTNSYPGIVGPNFQVTPEPSTAVLWLTGMGLMIVMMRKRIVQGLPQAR
jgi:Domain of unknown function (DUF4082)